MKKSNSSNANKPKKEVIITIISCVIFFAIGSLIVTAKNAKDSEAKTTDSKTTHSKTIDNENADDKTIKEEITESTYLDYSFLPNPDIYKIYAPYGLTVSQDGTKLEYEGQQVRLFDDELADAMVFYLNEEGAVDVSAVRNSSGGIEGVAPITKDQAKDLRKKFFKDDNERQETVNEVSAVSRYDQYLPFGITVSKDNKILYFNNERVRTLLDHVGDNPYYTLWDDAEGTIDLTVNRNSDGNITNIEKLTEKQIQKFKSELDEYLKKFEDPAFEEKLEKKFEDSEFEEKLEKRIDDLNLPRIE